MKAIKVCPDIMGQVTFKTTRFEELHPCSTKPLANRLID
jgi:hypothetical protein